MSDLPDNPNGYTKYKLAPLKSKKADGRNN